MNTIITIKRLVDMLATQANIPEHKAQAFVESFTYEIKEGLRQDNSVKVKDLGEFSIEGEKIIFVPDVAFASVINAPFAMFEPEVLAEGITAQELSQPIAPVVVPEAKEVIRPTEKAPEPDVEETEVEESVVVEETKIEELTVEETLVEETVVKEQIINESKKGETKVEANILVDPEPIYASKEIVKEEEEQQQQQQQQQQQEQPLTKSEEKSIPEPEAETNKDIEPQKEYSFPTFWVIIGLLTGLILGIGIGFFVHDPIQEFLEPSLVEEPVEITDEELAVLDLFSEESPAETADQAPEQPTVAENAPASVTVKAEEESQAATANASSAQEQTKPTEVYDIVTSNLAALSKKHYGDKVYWVYIYLENKDKIPNPNRVSNNIKLKIPPLEKYATQSSESERKEVAKKKANEILAKYK